MKVILLTLALMGSAAAQSIVMKDGKVVAAKALRRDRETIIATVDLPAAEPGQPSKSGDFGFALKQIARLDFPEPPQLHTAQDLLLQGQATEAIAQLDPVVRYYEGFRDAPGSWWAAAALLKAQALGSLGRGSEAEAIARQITGLATDPEAVRGAEVQLAIGLVSKGSLEQALAVAEKALKEAKRPATLALASILKGNCLLANKEWEDAILAFLQVPVFYPGEKQLLPVAALGAGRAEFGMDDFPRANATLNELMNTYSATPEAALAKAEIEKIARREKALAPPQ